MATKIKSSTITINYEEYVTDTLSIDLTWKDSSGTPIDLTGYTGLFEIRAKVTDTLPLLTRDDTNGLDLGSSDSNITIDLTPTDLATLGPSSFVYFIRLTEPSGKVNTLVTGSISLANP